MAGIAYIYNIISNPSPKPPSIRISFPAKLKPSIAGLLMNHKGIKTRPTYREKTTLFLLLAFDDDNDERIKQIYDNLRLITEREDSTEDLEALMVWD